jgi:hypothetical protein
MFQGAAEIHEFPNPRKSGIRSMIIRRKIVFILIAFIASDRAAFSIRFRELRYKARV